MSRTIQREEPEHVEPVSAPLSIPTVGLRPEILLCPNIPKPLHGLAPRVIFGQAWWDNERRAAYARAGFCCLACGVPKMEAEFHHWLEAHEIYHYDYPRGRLVFREIVALCHACHNYIHSGRLRALTDKGEIAPGKARRIMARGDAILKLANLTRPKPPTDVARWQDWRMVIDGKAYGPAFASFSEWNAHYNPGADDELEFEDESMFH